MKEKSLLLVLLCKAVNKGEWIIHVKICIFWMKNRKEDIRGNAKSLHLSGSFCKKQPTIYFLSHQ